MSSVQCQFYLEIFSNHLIVEVNKIPRKIEDVKTEVDNNGATLDKTFDLIDSGIKGILMQAVYSTKPKNIASWK